MMVKPIGALELHYPRIKAVICPKNILVSIILGNFMNKLQVKTSGLMKCFVSSINLIK